MRMQIARNVLWLVLERGLQVVFGIVSVALIARAVGPEGFAEFQYAQSLVLIASAFALICGNEVVIPRLVADQAPAAQHRLLAHVFGLRELAAVVGYVLLVLVVAMTEEDQVIVVIVIIVGIPMLFREPFGAVRSWLQARTDSRPGVIFGMVGLAFRMVAVGALYLAGTKSAPDYAWVVAVESLLFAVLLARYYRKRSPRVAVQFDWSLARTLLRDGTVFWMGMMLMLCAKRIDQLLLKPHISLYELGGYAACMQVLDNFMMLSAIVASSVAPLMIYAQPNLALVRRNVMYVAAGMIAMGAVGGAVLAYCAPWIIELIYGSHYDAAASLLRLSAMASGLVFADAALSLLVIYLRKPNWLVEKWLLVLSTMVVVDLIAIPTYGAQGAVYGYIAGNAVAVLAGIGFFLRSREPVAVEQAAA
ncbi:membrane protein [Cupriavidus sp. TA19]|uniref:lipopolysaccharide biosynthesis protein n=1 Tax=unclassified Cupriavidus TaxID=2640874 RepID=UPI00272948DC|nr:oligosaccharide flippase family protein [Cupriavidus sp. TA19]GLC90640.1 membrane protein [Cupriavidus sp. TA19]